MTPLHLSPERTIQYSVSLDQGGTNYMSTEIARILLRIKNRYEVDISLRLPW